MSDCLNKHKKRGDKRKSKRKCLNELKERCLSSKVVLVKTIRTRMEMIVSIAAQLKNLRVIHLVRDPRPTVKSRLRIGDSCDEGVKQCARKHCSNVYNDSLVRDKTPELRNSVAVVTYEELAKAPIPTSKRLYEFINITYTQSTADFVKSITVGGNRTECSICRQSWQLGNQTLSSMVYVDSWKRKMSQTMIATIEKSCKSVLDMYRYEILYQ